MNAKAISDLGKELYKRLSGLGGHVAELGKKLEKAVAAYNEAVGCLESRVLVSARRFRDLQAAGTEAELEAIAPVEVVPRQIGSEEYLATCRYAPTRPRQSAGALETSTTAPPHRNKAHRLPAVQFKWLYPECSEPALLAHTSISTRSCSSRNAAASRSIPDTTLCLSWTP